MTSQTLKALQDRRDAIKERIDLRDYILNDTGEKPKARTHEWIQITNPFRAGRQLTPSFTIWSDHYFDYDGDETGDIFDYVMQRKGITDFKEAIAFLDGGEILPKYEPRVLTPNVTSMPASVISSYDIMFLEAQLPLSLPYLQQRMISEDVARRMHFGVQVKHPNRYEFLDGSYIFIAADRVAIPNFVYGKPVGINLRLDELRAKENLANMDPDLKKRITADLVARYGKKTFTRSEINAAVFGAKYKQRSGSRRALYNSRRLMDPSGQNLVRIPYIFWHEGELNCTSAETVGYPSTAGMGKETNLAIAFSQVTIPIFVQENDSGAGEKWAHKAWENAGRKGRILPIPDPYKDANDMILAGVWKDFVYEKLGILPVELN